MRPPSSFIHRDLQHHYHAIKAMRTASMARPSKRQLAGRSNQTKKARISDEGEPKAQATPQSEEATGPPSESDEGSDPRA